MSQYTFQFNDLAAYASAKASGGSIATALSGVSSTDISRSVVSYIKGIGQAVTDSVNLFVPYAKGGLAGDVLYYTGTEYCWLKSPSDALDGSVLGQNIINTSAIPTSWVRVGAVPTSESKDVQIGMQAYQPGAAMVKVEKLLGNSVAWNQLVESPPASSTTGNVVFTNNGNGSMTINGTAEGRNVPSNNMLNFTASGHKYLVRGKHIQIRKDNASFLVMDDDCIFTSVADSVYDFRFLVINGTTVNETVFPQVFDLTLMFGESVANTMTVEMFEKLFPLSYYEYNPCEIISNEAAAVKGIGRNLWDEEWEVGGINDTTGEKSTSNTQFRSKDFIPVFPNTTYYFIGPSSVSYLYEYDAGKDFIGRIRINNSYNIISGSFITSADTHYLMLKCNGTIYNHDICISLSGPQDGTYEPYKESIAKLDAKKIYGKMNGTGNYVQVFPNGIRSAKTVYDEVDYQSRSAVVRVDNVDLGSLNWTYAASRFYSNPIETAKAPSYILLSTKYLPSGSFFIGNNKSLYVSDSSYSDAATFKTAMQGVELVYELATPVYYTDLKFSDDNGATFHDLPRPFYYTAGLEMKDPQDTASSVTAPARILASYKPIKK